MLEAAVFDGLSDSESRFLRNYQNTEGNLQKNKLALSRTLSKWVSIGRLKLNRWDAWGA